jgi:GT2 family glycosyltransferase
MLVHNRPKLTKQALSTIGHHDDLLILDDCSDEETKQLFHDFNVNVYSLGESKGTGYARNKVIEVSENIFGRGEYLYLSDNDVSFLREDWLRILICCYQIAWQHGFKVLGAYNHPFHIPTGFPVHVRIPELKPLPVNIAVNPYDTIKIESFRVDEVQALALQSMLMKWEVWDKYGPFNETPPGRVCMGEDVEFGWKITKDGGRLGVVSPPLLVNTGITNSFGEKIPGWEMVKTQIPPGVFCE